MELSQVKTVEKLAAMIKSLDMVTSIPWTDYSGDSTIVGWIDGVPNVQNKLRYKKIGNLIFVQFGFHGTNPTGTAVNFTLPFTVGGGIDIIIMSTGARDDTNWQVGRYDIDQDSATINCYPLFTGGAGAWTNSGTRGIWGEFWYIAA